MWLNSFWVAPDNLLFLAIDLSILFALILVSSITSRYFIKNCITTSILFSLLIELVLLILIVVVTYPLRSWLIGKLKINANLKNYFLDDKVVYIGILGVIYSSSLGTIQNSIMATTSILILSLLSGYNNQNEIQHKQSNVLAVPSFTALRKV